jgi:hypothetical protein
VLAALVGGSSNDFSCVDFACSEHYLSLPAPHWPNSTELRRAAVKY